MKTASILIRNVPSEDHDRLREIAQRKDSDVSKIMRRLIRRFVQSHTKQEAA